MMWLFYYLFLVYLCHFISYLLTFHPLFAILYLMTVFWTFNNYAAKETATIGF